MTKVESQQTREIPVTPTNLGQHPMADSFRRRVAGIVLTGLAIVGTFAGTLLMGDLAIKEIPEILNSINQGNVSETIYHGLNAAGRTFVAGSFLLLSVATSYWTISELSARR